MIKETDTEVFGTVTSFKFDGHTMSSPAFMNIAVESENGPMEVYAQGKLAKALVGKLTEGLRVTLTLDDNRILTFESYE